MVRVAFAAAPWLLLCTASGAHGQTGGQSTLLQIRIPVGLIEPDIPIGKPLTVEQVELGRKLFFDERLSGSGKTSCATCHRPERAFTELKPTSASDDGTVQRRNAPSLFNAGFLTTAMWDGRFASLEAQAIDPFRVDGDMSIGLDRVLDCIGSDAEYDELFRAAFGRPPTVDDFATSLAAFQRTLLSGGTRFDRFLFLGEKDALSELEQQGFEVFVVQGACINCHDVFHPTTNPLGGRIALFTDHRFHNLGVGYRNGQMADLGRYYETRRPEDWGAFRTPTLRNVAVTAPYMHDGSLATLEEVVDFYDRGGQKNPNISPTLGPLLLTPAEKKALVAFLHTLTDPSLEQ